MKLLGLFTGLTVSVIANQKWIRFEVKGTLLQKILIVGLGAMGAGVILVAGKFIFTHEVFGDLLRYLIMMIWVGMGIPWLLKKGL
jgi:hypothetical protein